MEPRWPFHELRARGGIGFVSRSKRKLVHRCSWPIRQSIRIEIPFEYIEAFYNTRRRHSALGHLCPVEYEEARTKGKAVA